MGSLRSGMSPTLMLSMDSRFIAIYLVGGISRGEA
jgi:hypothetical protein